jgi:eukaryotic-like serine/threonine-protein kinase
MDPLPRPKTSGLRIESSRYELLVRVASGGMGTVYVGRRHGAGGFSRLVAIKRAHPHLLEDAVFRRMLAKEARLASLVHHPNVVGVLDVEELDDELLLVMDYVHGVTLAALISRSNPPDDPPSVEVAVRIGLDACEGLHAVHELRDDSGERIGLVHRDVTPHNVLVGLDGVARISDFGIAKSTRQDDKLTTTGQLRGKVGYMAPEYVADGVCDVQSDVFSLGVVLWESLSGRRLFRGTSELDTLKRVVACEIPPFQQVAPWASGEIEAVVRKALARDPSERFQTAEALGAALEQAARSAGRVARRREVSQAVDALFGTALAERKALATSAHPADPVTGTLSSSEAPGRVAFVEGSTLARSTVSRAASPPERGVRPRRAALMAVGALLLGGGAQWALGGGARLASESPVQRLSLPLGSRIRPVPAIQVAPSAHPAEPPSAGAVEAPPGADPASEDPAVDSPPTAISPPRSGRAALIPPPPPHRPAPSIPRASPDPATTARPNPYGSGNGS